MPGTERISVATIPQRSCADTRRSTRNRRASLASVANSPVFGSLTTITVKSKTFQPSLK